MIVGALFGIHLHTLQKKVIQAQLCATAAPQTFCLAVEDKMCHENQGLCMATFQ